MPAHDPGPRPAARSEPVPPLRRSSRSRQRVVVSLSSLAKAAPGPGEEEQLGPARAHVSPPPATVASPGAEQRPAPTPPSSVFMEEEEPSFEAAPFGWKELQPGELPTVDVPDGEVFQTEAPPTVARTDLDGKGRLPVLPTERNAAPSNPAAVPSNRPPLIADTGSGKSLRELPAIKVPAHPSSATSPENSAMPLPPVPPRRRDPSLIPQYSAAPKIPTREKDGGEVLPEAHQVEKRERRTLGSLFAQVLKPYVPRKPRAHGAPRATLPPLPAADSDEPMPVPSPVAAPREAARPTPPLQPAQTRPFESLREQTVSPQVAETAPMQAASPLAERTEPLERAPLEPAPLPEFVSTPAPPIAPLTPAPQAMVTLVEVEKAPEPIEIGPPKSKVPPEHSAAVLEEVEAATVVSAPAFLPLPTPASPASAPAAAAAPVADAPGISVPAAPFPTPAPPPALPNPIPRPEAIFSPPPADCNSAAPVLSRMPPLMPLTPLLPNATPPQAAGAVRVPPPILAAVFSPDSLAPLPTACLSAPPTRSLVRTEKVPDVLPPRAAIETDSPEPPARKETSPDTVPSSDLSPRPIEKAAPQPPTSIAEKPAVEPMTLVAPIFEAPREPVLPPVPMSLPPPLESPSLPMPSSYLPRPVIEARRVTISGSAPAMPSRVEASAPVVAISAAPIVELRPKAPAPNLVPASAGRAAASAPVVAISAAPIIEVRPASIPVPIPDAISALPALAESRAPVAAPLPLPAFQALNAPVRQKAASATPPPLPPAVPPATPPPGAPAQAAPVPAMTSEPAKAAALPPPLPAAVPKSTAARPANSRSTEARSGAHPIVRSSPPLEIGPRVTPPPLPPPLPAPRPEPRLIQARSFNTGQRPGLPAPVRIPVTIPIVPPLAQTPVSALHVPPRKKKRQVLADRLAAVMRAPKRLSAKKPATRLLPLPGQPVAAGASTPPVAPTAPDQLAAARAGRQRKRRLVSLVFFYTLLVAVLLVLGFGGLYYGQETRVEGQIIPPEGMTLSKDAMLVTDLRVDVAGVVDDYAKERLSKMPNIEFDNQHVQRAQADIAQREDRIRLLREQVQSAKEEISTTIKQARDQAQAIWDGPGTELDNSYNSRLDQLQKTIRDRAAALKLRYTPDDTYRSPEVWANAYRLALYQVPPGVDGTKEHEWLEAQMTGWRNFVKQLDVRKQELREQATQIQMSPTNKLADINTRIDGLLHQITSTQAEEVPIQSELQQAQADLATAQTDLAALQPVYLKQLSALPDAHASEHLAVHANGRFSVLDFKNAFLGDETARHFWILSRAYRADHTEYWSLNEFIVRKNLSTLLFIEPGSFVSTKVLLRPDLPASEAGL